MIIINLTLAGASHPDRLRVEDRLTKTRQRRRPAVVFIFLVFKTLPCASTTAGLICRGFKKQGSVARPAFVFQSCQNKTQPIFANI